MARTPSEDALAPTGEPGLAWRAARGATWTSTSALVAQVSQLVSGIVLARLLFPRDYGLTTVVWVVTSFAALFTDLGISSALVQKRDLGDDDLAAGFWANLLSGVALTALVAGAAPLLARIYGQPRLTGLLVLASFSFTVSSGVVPKALLERELRFGVIAIAESVGRVLGWGAAIAFAVAGFGASSLVLGPLLTFAITTVILFAAVRWVPRGFGSRAAYAGLWHYGSGLTGFNIANFFAHQSDSILVPLVTPARTVGLYNRAYNLMTLPVDQVGGTLVRVLLPAMAGMQDDLARLRRALRRSLLAICAVGFPVAAGLGATAPLLLPALFGDQWRDAVPLLQVLSIASIPQIAVLPLRSVYAALGETRRLFRYGLVQSALSVLAVVVGLPWGVHGVVIAIVVRHWVGIPLSLSPPLRLIGERLGSTLWLLAGPAAATAAMVAVVLVTAAVLRDLSPITKLAAEVGAGVVAYPLALAVASPASWTELRVVARRRPA